MHIPLLGTSREKYYRSPRSSGIPQARVSRARTFATLGFFNSIDSKLPKLRSFKLPEFIQQIKDTFAEYPSDTLDALADTKCRVLDCIFNP